MRETFLKGGSFYNALWWFYPLAGSGRRVWRPLEEALESLPVVPITLEEVGERTAKWRVRRGSRS